MAITVAGTSPERTGPEAGSKDDLATNYPAGIPRPDARQDGQARAQGKLLLLMPSLPFEARQQALGNIAAAFGSMSLIVATPDEHTPEDYATDAYRSANHTVPDSASGGDAMGRGVDRGRGLPEGMKVVPHALSTGQGTSWTLSALDYLHVHQLVTTHGATAALLLGAEAQSLSSAALAALAAPLLAGTMDLSLPRYTLAPRTGLVNSAILYPVHRALFTSAARFPQAIDVGLSARMAARMATAAERFTTQNQSDALMWPVAEAAVAGFKAADAPVGARTLPAPVSVDLNSVLALVAGSLFSEIESKAAYWQRARPSPAASGEASPAPITSDSAGAGEPPEDPGGRRRTDHAGPDLQPDLQPMIEAFHLAYTNLHEIWSMVLPPQSLLALKRLAAQEAAGFRMAESLWARIVYDFILAYRLRTINRGHLLGALTPLYLGWVASHLLLTSSTSLSAEAHIASVARAFESDKAYLVSRWRWPDRFNP